MSLPPVTDEDFRQSEEKFRLLVASVRDYAIFLLDRDGRVQSWNAGAQAIKGYSAMEVLGQPIDIFYTDEDRSSGKAKRMLSEAMAMGRVEDEGWRVRKDGTKFWADVVITVLKDAAGRVIGFAKVTRDLTERRKSEQTRIALAEAQTAIRLRDDFLAIASHELKTPLTAIQLTLEGIRRKLTDPALVERFKRATEAQLRMSQLVDSLLDATAMAGGLLKLEPVPCDLSTIVQGAVEAFKPTALASGCAITSELNAGAVAGAWDPVRLGQVVTNLLGNAAKYGPQKPVVVMLGREPGRVVLTVRDHGPGIAPDDRERVFGRFEHGAGLRDWGGLGLGLFAARYIVEGHQGSIHAEEAPGGGALLVVRLPA